jgi:hypothetical protein
MLVRNSTQDEENAVPKVRVETLTKQLAAEKEHAQQVRIERAV